MDQFKPIDPAYRPTRTLTELSEERPALDGLKQLASAERMDAPPPQLEGLRPDLWRNTSGGKR